MIKDTDEGIEEFLDRLRIHAKRKRELYDGVERAMPEKDTPDAWLRYATEELGEVAGAITRDRYMLARYECVDLAHTAMLLYLVLSTILE